MIVLRKFVCSSEQYTIWIKSVVNARFHWWASDFYEIGPVGGFECVTVCVIFVGAAVVNLVSVSWEAFAFNMVFSTSNWFIRSISSEIFSFNTSTSSRTANIKCDFTRSYLEIKINKTKTKTLEQIKSIAQNKTKQKNESTMTLTHCKRSFRFEFNKFGKQIFVYIFHWNTSNSSII